MDLVCPLALWGHGWACLLEAFWMGRIVSGLAAQMGGPAAHRSVIGLFLDLLSQQGWLACLQKEITGHLPAGVWPTGLLMDCVSRGHFKGHARPLAR